MSKDLFYQWDVNATTASDKRRAMDEVIIGVLRTLRFARLASSYYASKQRSSVRLCVIAHRGAKTDLCALVRSNLSTHTLAGPEPNGQSDPILGGEYKTYRRGLQRVTDIATELHSSKQQFEQHQKFLIQIRCDPANPRTRLHDYLRQNSKVYRARYRTRIAEEEFWRDFFTWGPAKEYSNPGHWLWNILLAIDWHVPCDPAAVAAHLGLSWP